MPLLRSGNPTVAARNGDRHSLAVRIFKETDDDDEGKDSGDDGDAVL